MRVELATMDEVKILSTIENKKEDVDKDIKIFLINDQDKKLKNTKIYYSKLQKCI